MDIRGDHYVIKALWHCGWPQAGGYPGAYPARYLKYMYQLIQSLQAPLEPRLHLFSGTVKDGVTIDINPEVNPTHVLDLTRDPIPYPDDYFAVVLADPPYSHKDYKAAERHYNLPEVPRYSFVPEAVRVLKPGGIFAVLHVMPYRTPKGCERVAMIGVTTGTTQVIRVASVFQKRQSEEAQ